MLSFIRGTREQVPLPWEGLRNPCEGVLQCQKKDRVMDMLRSMSSRLSVSGERMCTILINRLEDLSLPSKRVVR